MRSPILEVRFFRTETGTEPVRDWLKSLTATDRKAIGEEIKTVQFGWPLGMPLVRKVGRDLWEVRIRLEGKAARVIFTEKEGLMVLLHGFIKKSNKIPKDDLELSHHRLQGTEVSSMNPAHIGNSFDDFLMEEAMLGETTARALKRVLAWQIVQEMKAQQLTRTALAERMGSSRAALNRLLDESDSSLTLTTLARAAAVLGKQIKVELTSD